jgi:hypothetical protein
MSDEEESPRDDGEIMNLALGCLFNIVQDADDNGEPILDLSEYSPRCENARQNVYPLHFDLGIGRPCQGQRSCLKQCRCAGGLSALGHLASIFVNQQKRNTDDVSLIFLNRIQPAADKLMMITAKCSFLKRISCAPFFTNSGREIRSGRRPPQSSSW